MSDHCDHPKIADFAGLTVGDVMVSRPKTLDARATVGDVRRTFANPHVIAALLVDGEAFAGLLYREWLPEEVPDDVPALPYARRDVPSVTPETPVGEALRLLDGVHRRLVVVADDGRRLAGLVCLDESGESFCRSDLDQVASGS